MNILIVLNYLTIMFLLIKAGNLLEWNVFASIFVSFVVFLINFIFAKAATYESDRNTK